MGREEPHFVKHPGEASDGIGTARESEKRDAVAFTIVLHEEGVGVLNMYSETAAYRHVETSGQTSFQGMGVRVGTNAGLVVCDLKWVIFLETGDKFDNIAVICVELVTSAIETDDNGARRAGAFVTHGTNRFWDGTNRFGRCGKDGLVWEEDRRYR